MLSGERVMVASLVVGLFKVAFVVYLTCSASLAAGVTRRLMA